MTAFLDDAVIPLRLASSGESGPLVQSMWFLRRGGTLWCATQNDALVVRRLRRDPRAGYEVAADVPPYRGVRGRGHVAVSDRGAVDVLEELIGRYLGDTDPGLAGWLRSRSAHEVALCLTPSTIHSWDFSSRMGSPGR